MTGGSLPLAGATFEPALPGVSGVELAVGEPARALAELSTILDVPPELERAVPKRRAEFLTGRHAASLALARLGRPGAVGRGANGSPAWPDGVVGSITHGGGVAAAAVASDHTHLGLGIDIESMMTESTARRLCAKIARDEELRTITDVMPASGDLGLVLSLVFSVKESLYKCTHPRTGEFLWFDDVRLVGFRRLSESTGACDLAVARPASHALLAAGRLSAWVAWSKDRVSSAVALTRALD